MNGTLIQVVCVKCKTVAITQYIEQIRVKSEVVRSGRQQNQNKRILCSCYSLITISLKKKNYSNSVLFMFNIKEYQVNSHWFSFNLPAGKACDDYLAIHLLW